MATTGMRAFPSSAAAIAAFDSARVALGCVAVIPDPDKFVRTGGGVEEYLRIVREVQDQRACEVCGTFSSYKRWPACDTAAHSLPAPRLPELACKGEVVRYETGSGSTVLRVTGRVLRMDRHKGIHPKDGRRTALAVLSGYGASRRRHENVPPEVDPRPAAERWLKKRGLEEYIPLVGTYVPDPKFWHRQMKTAPSEWR